MFERVRERYAGQSHQVEGDEDPENQVDRVSYSWEDAQQRVGGVARAYV